MDAIQIISVFEKAFNLCTEVELFYLLSGKLEMKIGKDVFYMVPKDLIVVNLNENYLWRAEKCQNGEASALVCKVEMEYNLLKKAAGGENIYFSCNSVKNPEGDYGRLRYILDILVRKLVEKQNELVIRSLYYTLWEDLKNQFTVKDESEGQRQDEKIEAIRKEIQENYDRPLNLHVMAEKWYMSESAFSRYFKKETGMKFVDYIRKIRLEKAKEALRYTGKSITEIALDCGFPNSSVFNKSFKEYYQMTPSAYRLTERSEEDSGPDQEKMEELNNYLAASVLNNEAEKKLCRQITVDVTRTKAYRDSVFTCLNAGRLSDLQERKVQEHIKMVVERLPVRYVRVSNIFDSDLKIRMQHDNCNINFDKLDVVFDFLQEIGVNPLLEFPEKLQKTVVAVGKNRQLEKFCQEPVIESLEEWIGLLQAFLEHVTERYTNHRIRSWRFEVWYDIEQKTGAGKLPYTQMYMETCRMIRQYIPEAKIGASGLNIEMSADILKEQLLFWKEIDERPDFLTLICYPYQVEKEYEGSYKLKSIRSDTHFMRQEITAYKQMLRELEYPETSIWITEWNTSLSERNIYNDSCAKACHMLTQMLDMVDQVDAMSYWDISDWHASSYDVKIPFVGAAGLITKDGVCKPAYYAMEFWSFVGEQIVSKGENYIVSAREDGTFSILAFNPKRFSYKYQLRDENEFQIQDLPYLFQDRAVLHLSFALRNIANGKRKIRQFRISESRGDVLSAWGKLGYTDSLSPVEISYLKKICIPQMEVRQEQVEDHTIRLKMELEANEIRLVLIF